MLGIMRLSLTVFALVAFIVSCGGDDGAAGPAGAGSTAGPAGAGSTAGPAGGGDGRTDAGATSGSGGAGGSAPNDASSEAASPGSDGASAALDATATDARTDAAIDSEPSDGARSDRSIPDSADSDAARADGSSPDGRSLDAGARGWLGGVNLSCAEFGAGSVPGVYGKDYTYPTHAEIDYFVGKGMKVFRLPFLWERLQRTLGGDLDAAELGHIDDVVSYATGRGATVIVDPHNYARYKGTAIGSGLADADLGDLWSRLAAHLKGNAGAIFGLMNEPHDLPSAAWGSAANAAMAAIRQAGAPNLVLVPGNCWTGAHSWTSCDQGASAAAMLGIVDSGHNYAFEVHQYLDADSSGTSATCVDGAIGKKRLTAFTQWARDHGARAMLGEVAGANNETCNLAISDMLAFMAANDDVWIGFTWWAAGPWWGEYMFTLEPKQGVDRPQIGLLLPFL
jgi:endoglucanase